MPRPSPKRWGGTSPAPKTSPDQRVRPDIAGRGGSGPGQLPPVRASPPSPSSVWSMQASSARPVAPPQNGSSRVGPSLSNSTVAPTSSAAAATATVTTVQRASRRRRILARYRSSFSPGRRSRAGRIRSKQRAQPTVPLGQRCSCGTARSSPHSGHHVKRSAFTGSGTPSSVRATARLVAIKVMFARPASIGQGPA